MGNTATHISAIISNMRRIHIRTVRDASQAAPPARTRNMTPARQSIIQKKDTPLLSDLGSRTIIPAKKQNDTTNKIIAICHMATAPPHFLQASTPCPG